MMNEGDYMGVPIGLIVAISSMSHSAVDKMMELAIEHAEREQLRRLKEKYEG